MKKELLSICASFIFYSKIPFLFNVKDIHFSRSSRYLPLVGIVIGLIMGSMSLFCHYIFPTSIAVLLTILIGLFCTGAIHEEGLARASDGFISGWSKDGILSIMKDSSIAVFGVISLVVVLMFRATSIGSISAGQLPLVLIAGNAISRMFAVSFMLTQAHVPDPVSGRSEATIERMSFWVFLIPFFLGILPLLLLDTYWVFLVILPLFLVRWIMGFFFKKWIGGFTLDCVSATQQVCEIIFYLFIVAAPWKFIPADLF